jgi:hypothetical protein
VVENHAVVECVVELGLSLQLPKLSFLKSLQVILDQENGSSVNPMPQPESNQECEQLRAKLTSDIIPTIETVSDPLLCSIVNSQPSESVKLLDHLKRKLNPEYDKVVLCKVLSKLQNQDSQKFDWLVLEVKKRYPDLVNEASQNSWDETFNRYKKLIGDQKILAIVQLMNEFIPEVEKNLPEE